MSDEYHIKITEMIYELSGITPDLQAKIFGSALIIAVLWIIRFVSLRIIWRRTEVVQQRYRWQKSTTYVMVSIGIILVGRIWFAGIQSLATFLGLVTAGLAIALQDIVKSMAGWVFLLWRKPFTLGDRVQIGTYAGDVIDIRLFKFTMMEIGNWVRADQSTGRLIHLPNSLVLTEVIANFGQGFQFIWNELAVLVTFESNWRDAKAILQEIATRHAAHLSEAAEKKIKEASKRFMIFYSALTPTVYTSVEDSGVLLTLRYLINPRRRRSSEQAIWEDILTAFAQRNDIDFAYPTQRFYDNAAEGKEKARARINKNG